MQPNLRGPVCCLCEEPGAVTAAGDTWCSKCYDTYCAKCHECGGELGRKHGNRCGTCRNHFCKKHLESLYQLTGQYGVVCHPCSLRGDL